ncbi:bifunctional glutamate N-acetyltransferase/amino-acid acetyltransferase ArgJ [Magnetococcales bacterium HHB-1]
MEEQVQNDLPDVAGFESATMACGIKPTSQQRDMFLVKMTAPCAVAGVFTKNQVVAAPVTLCRDHLRHGVARALWVNSGNANAANGPQGERDNRKITKKVAQLLDLRVEEVFAASTGVIGENLPVERMVAAMPTLVDSLDSKNHWYQVAQAMMTTDTVPKAVSKQITLDNQTVTLVGIAKGSGMIHPNMATMLSYIFTDAVIDSTLLQKILNQAVKESFNCITVDGDMSTNDTLMAFASAKAGHAPIQEENRTAYKKFSEALLEVCQKLAKALVKDGEGASKFITVHVKGALTKNDAKKIAFAVANSSLVKTACFGCDPNWGRILAAVGYAEIPLDLRRLKIYLADVCIVDGGMRAADYTEAMGAAIMQQWDIPITIDLAQGEQEITVWTSDLSREYVSINADYRT